MIKLPSIAFELTARCNQKCVYCYNSWRDDPTRVPDELPTAEICRLIDRVLAEAELRHITLTGGEPFMRDDIFDIIDHIGGRGLPVVLISNGGRIDGETARRLSERNVQYVQITLGGPNAELHDAICGPGSFRNTTDGVAALVAAGVAVGGSFLCTRHNFDKAAETFEQMHRLGIRNHFALNRFNPSGCGAEHLTELMPTRSEVLTALEQADRFAADHEVRVHCTMPIPHCMIEEKEYPLVKFGQCAAGSMRGEYAVDPQGNLKLCTLQRHAVGNLRDTPLSTLIDSDQAKQFRAAIPRFCRICRHRDTCLGGCGAAAEWIYGRPDRLDPFLAQHVKTEVPETAIVAGVDPWYDLVYHVLSYLPIHASDASTLFDSSYVTWCDRRLTANVPPDAPIARTLTIDAPLLARLYADSKQASLLHAFPLLHDGIEDFRQTASTDFKDLTWSSPQRKRLADAILTGTHPALPDLFRTAIWSEIVNRFAEFHSEHLAPPAEEYRPRFVDHIRSLAEELPELADMTWILSYPMRNHGRLLHRTSAKPIIVVGVGDDLLNVSASFPVIQGVHEYFVWKARHSAASSGDTWSSVAGRAGYRAFQAVENAGLSLGARFFISSRWEPMYFEWLERIFPNTPAPETAAKLQAGKSAWLDDGSHDENP